jgi:hypothetical protein
MQRAWFLLACCDKQGAIANRLCNGLQIRGAQFDSGSRLQIYEEIADKECPVKAYGGAFCLTMLLCPSGEIGRHIGLKIRRFLNKGHTGSIPVSGTN